MTCSIFIASITTTVAPAATSSPTATAMVPTVPCMGAGTGTSPSDRAAPGRDPVAPEAAEVEHGQRIGAIDHRPCGAPRGGTSPAQPGGVRLQPGRVDVAGADGGVPQQRGQERGVGLHAGDLEPVERRRRCGQERVGLVRRDDHLGQERVVAGAGRVPRDRRRVLGEGVHPHARAGAAKREMVPPAGTGCPSGPTDSISTRACSAAPVAGGGENSPSVLSDDPPARASCSCTRSRPVIASVTVCSTCRRALHSMKAMRSPATRNSTVPRET